MATEQESTLWDSDGPSLEWLQRLLPAFLRLRSFGVNEKSVRRCIEGQCGARLLNYISRIWGPYALVLAASGRSAPRRIFRLGFADESRSAEQQFAELEAREGEVWVLDRDRLVSTWDGWC